MARCLKFQVNRYFMPPTTETAQRLGFVELAGALVLDRQQPHVDGPGEWKDREELPQAYFRWKWYQICQTLSGELLHP